MSTSITRMSRTKTSFKGASGSAWCWHPHCVAHCARHLGRFKRKDTSSDGTEIAPVGSLEPHLLGESVWTLAPAHVRHGTALRGLPGRPLSQREPQFLRGARWIPDVDVFEKDGNLVIRADLPGLTKEDVNIEVTDEAITIHGERKEEFSEEREGLYVLERAYGGFSRSVPLPDGVKMDDIKATFENGVLKVMAPLPPGKQTVKPAAWKSWRAQRNEASRAPSLSGSPRIMAVSRRPPRGYRGRDERAVPRCEAPYSRRSLYTYGRELSADASALRPFNLAMSSSLISKSKTPRFSARWSLRFALGIGTVPNWRFQRMSN